MRANAIKTTMRGLFIAALPRLLLMQFRFSTQLVFTATNCPTKPTDVSESSLVD